jgi:transcriptional antiterminator RfaH
MKAWYVVYTHPSAETKAAYNLRRQNFTVYLPQYGKQIRHARRTEIVRSAFFPRYFFVNLDLETDRWRSVNSTFGVIHLICFGDIPARLPNEFIAQIRARESADGLVETGHVHCFAHGQDVEILAGAFVGQIGVFDCSTDDDRVRILLNVLGRTVQLRLPPQAIGACS